MHVNRVCFQLFRNQALASIDSVFSATPASLHLWGVEVLRIDIVHCAGRAKGRHRPSLPQA